jgi:hypothetical protein
MNSSYLSISESIMQHFINTHVSILLILNYTFM